MATPSVPRPPIRWSNLRRGGLVGVDDAGNVYVLRDDTRIPGRPISVSVLYVAFGRLVRLVLGTARSTSHGRHVAARARRELAL